jgi:hypothetical protein
LKSTWKHWQKKSAKKKVFNFNHEEANGRTSSISHEILGFCEKGDEDEEDDDDDVQKPSGSGGSGASSSSTSSSSSALKENAEGKKENAERESESNKDGKEKASNGEEGDNKSNKEDNKDGKEDNSKSNNTANNNGSNNGSNNGNGKKRGKKDEEISHTSDPTKGDASVKLTPGDSGHYNTCGSKPFEVVSLENHEQTRVLHTVFMMKYFLI